jgi:hypothetical protein
LVDPVSHSTNKDLSSFATQNSKVVIKLLMACNQDFLLVNQAFTSCNQGFLLENQALHALQQRLSIGYTSISCSAKDFFLVHKRS